MIRVVADLGNSRLKCARLASDGTLGPVLALSLGDPDSWLSALRASGLGAARSHWAVASVNPSRAQRLRELLDTLQVDTARLFQSAAEVPVRHLLDRPDHTGVDRALAVWEAVRRYPAGQAGHVVLCGSALTIERITADGIWRGGAIAPGLSLAARSLNRLTAQLPLISPGTNAPSSWGPNTDSALTAGLFWGAIGTLRELLARQNEGSDTPAWVVWSGGDAAALATHVQIDSPPTIAPNLVLEGLARLAFDLDCPV